MWSWISTSLQIRYRSVEGSHTRYYLHLYVSAWWQARRSVGSTKPVREVLNRYITWSILSPSSMLILINCCWLRSTYPVPPRLYTLIAFNNRENETYRCSSVPVPVAGKTCKELVWFVQPTCETFLCLYLVCIHAYLSTLYVEGAGAKVMNPGVSVGFAGWWLVPGRL